MLTADGKIVDHDIVVGTTAEGDAILGEDHLLQNLVVEKDDQLGHGINPLKIDSPCIIQASARLNRMIMTEILSTPPAIFAS